MNSPINEQNILSFASVACAGIAAVILLVYLVRRPGLGQATKLWLFAGLGVFPIAAAASANVQGYKASQHRAFCGSCHVMIPQALDSNDPKSHSLAAIHARNRFFGQDNCYTCHEDYGLFGTLFTKLGGMRHVWLYATQYRTMPLEISNAKIHLLKPFPNDNCMQCHTATAPEWNRVPDHASARADVTADRISCSSPGCHGVAHPTVRPAPLPSVDGPTGVGAEERKAP